MGLRLIEFITIILIGLMSIYSLSASAFISPAKSLNYNANERSDGHDYGDIKSPLSDPKDTNIVKFVKSFKNSTGFFKIDGTLVNQGVIILSDIKVIQYHKIPTVNDTTLICYEKHNLDCNYKSNDGAILPKSFFMMLPPASP